MIYHKIKWLNFKTIIFGLTLSLIILVSFFLYSSRFYPLLNSDDALNILMAHYYRLPDDFYCWGQDRGGTLIPLLSQIFIKLFGCSALIAVSLSNYLVLILGYIGLSSLIKSRYYKIIFAIIWFLPFQRFVDITRFPIGVEYSIIGAAIYLINKLDTDRNAFGNTKRKILLALIILLFIISIWVSDLSMVTIVILLSVLILYHYIEFKSIKIDKTVIIYAIVGLVSCLLFIKYAKSFAIVKTHNYLEINGLTQIKDALLILKDTFADVLFLEHNEVSVSVYMYFAIVFFVYFAIAILREKNIKHMLSNKWIVFFLIDTVAILGVIMLSSWVLANNMGRWYFVATYISLSMTVVLILDNFEKCMKPLRYGILVLVTIDAVSPVLNMKYVYPKRLTPMAEVVGEFQQLGEIGVIGEFWNSYRTSCPAPDIIVATPHDKSNVRNYKLTEMVFEKNDIYVIRDMWLSEFPDTLNQFGHVLIKSGMPFRIGDCDVCKYDKVN